MKPQLARMILSRRWSAMLGWQGLGLNREFMVYLFISWLIFFMVIHVLCIHGLFMYFRLNNSVISFGSWNHGIHRIFAEICQKISTISMVYFFFHGVFCLSIRFMVYSIKQISWCIISSRSYDVFYQANFILYLFSWCISSWGILSSIFRDVFCLSCVRNWFHVFGMSYLGDQFPCRIMESAMNLWGTWTELRNISYFWGSFFEISHVF